ncbi:MAG: PAS domain S-box protein [Chlorobiales bacterium]|nr:PAS domain S-box protein [Chlorobiales bacterium]
MSDTDNTMPLSRSNDELQKCVAVLEATLHKQEQTKVALEKNIATPVHPPEDALNIPFDNLFNMDDIQQLQDEFAAATCVASIITHPDGTPITAPSNFCQLCNDIIRKTEKGRANCFKSDATLGRVNSGGPCVQQCLSGGLWDAGASITVGGKHIANWLIGQVRDETQTDEKMRAYAREIGADEQDFMDAFHKVPAMSHNQFEKIARVLFTLANQLSASAYQNAQQRRFITERMLAEEKLRESEALYRSILKASPENITITDLEGRIQIFSPSGLTMFGYTQEEDVRGHLTSEFLAVEDRERAKYRIGLMHQGLLVGPGEYRGVHADGTLFDIEVNGEFIRDSVGQPTGMVFIIRDVTERKRVEASLAFAQLVIDHMADAAFWITEDGRFDYVNEAACLMTDYTKSEFLHLSIGDISENMSLEKWASHWQELKRSGCLFVEGRHKTKTGKIIPVEIRASYMTFGSKAYSCGLVRDISERKRAETERERLMAAIEQVAEVIIITDLAGTIQYANPAFERVTSYSRKEAIGQNPRILKSGKHDKVFYASIWRSLRKGKTWEGRFINKRKDGTLYTEEATISPVRDASGTIVNYVAVKRDITHELETEQYLLEVQKMESIGRLAGGVAHDINNMLMAIMGYAELCQNVLPAGSPISKWLDDITNASQRSANITRQLLAFARKQTISPKVLDLNETVASMIKLLRRLIGENIELAWMPGQDLWAVKFDPSQIDQILANLCVNARDAIANTGKIMIETENITIDDTYCVGHVGAVPGEYVLLVVSDDGSGMDKDIFDHIFEPFFTTKGIGKGTGLGLATVYGIIKQNNGFIIVYSEPGKGTTFRIYLPRFVGEFEKPTVARTIEIPRGQGETILLVEDEESLRTTCGRLLDDLGYNVLEAESPEAAIEIVARHSGDIHLLLTDVIMPGMNGKELAEWLCTLKRDLKVLFMSGYPADVISHHGVLEQGVHFIEKPFSLGNISRKLRDILDKQIG